MERPTTDERRNQIFLEIRVKLLEVAQYYIRDAKAREDVAQQAVLVLVQKYEALPSKEGILAFALQILRNKIGDYYRQERHARRLFIGIDARDGDSASDQSPADRLTGGTRPDELLEKSELHDQLLKAIDQLGPECRAILLGLLEEKSRADLAAERHKSIQALYQQLFRCMEHLRTLLRRNT